MSARIAAPTHGDVRWAPRARPLVAALVLALALAVTACGSGTPVGGASALRHAPPHATATATPTQAPTPVPCTTWQIIPSPNPPSLPNSRLVAVSALAPADTWAVGGTYVFDDLAQTLIERWDGTAWRVVPSPNRSGANQTFLQGVAAVSPRDAWAVGSNKVRPTTPTDTLVEHWDGAQWSIVPSPDSGPGSTDNVLSSVVALAADTVWAVGSSRSADGTRLPLTERWDGTAWHRIMGPARPSGALGSELSGVVALSPTDAWAVGDYFARDHTRRALIAHWNGTACQVVASPDAWATLSSVTAAGARDVRAVGTFYDGSGSGVGQATFEQWDGSAWHLVASPAPRGALSRSLSAVTTDDAGTFWAVGSDRTAGGTFQTLTAHCP